MAPGKSSPIGVSAALLKWIWSNINEVRVAHDVLFLTNLKRKALRRMRDRDCGHCIETCSIF
jgi:hypothetical protein